MNPSPHETARSSRKDSSSDLREQLRRQTELLTALIDNIPVLLCIWDPYLQRFQFNRQMVDVLGWTEEDAEQGFMEKVYPDAALREEVIRFMQSHESGWRDVKTTAKDGTVIDIAWANVRLSDDASVGIGVDIRPRLEAQAALKASEVQLQQRVAERTATLEALAARLRLLAGDLATTEQRERRRLAALLHDDLQQYLVAAKMGLGQARSHANDPVMLKKLDAIARALDQAVESSRDLTRELRPPVLYEGGLVPALRWLIGEMQRKHDLTVTLDAEDARVPLLDDTKALLYESVRELLMNVAQHAGTDRATMRIQEESGAFRIEVQDSGRGFDPSVLQDSARGGLGLFRVQQRLAALSGAMRVESAPGEGTCVRLSLPLNPAAHDEARLPAPAIAAPDRGAEPSAAQVRLLVVDDHRVVRQGLAFMLGDDPRVTVIAEAGDGVEAIAAVEKHVPDVVLIDVNMPRMNGVDATREICRRWPGVRVVGMSVQDDEATANTMRSVGAAAFVPKAADAQQMMAAILPA